MATSSYPQGPWTGHLPFFSVPSKLARNFAAGLLVLLPSLLAAQITVDNSLTPLQLAESLVGDGVTVENVVLNCPNDAFGSFDGTASGLGVDSGVVLTSGSIFEVLGPNDEGGAGLDNGAPGDPLLDPISAATTFNACRLEFDVTPIADTLLFRYVFGSEEYLEFVDAGFNDIFAFFIAGPGITGTENIALIPGTTTPVSIDNVNDMDFPMFYVDNGDGFTAPFSTDPFYIQYDGYTTVLEARRAVTPCSTYRLTLAIADAGDGILDSGVFIEAGSLTSFGVELSSTTSVGFGFDNAVEGCVDGIITFTRSNVTADTLTVRYGIGGTATNGIDYFSIDTSINILPDSADALLTISPIVDGIAEGLESVTIYLLSDCSDAPIDSITLFIQDEILLDVSTSADTTICNGAPIGLSVTGGLDYTWTPAGELDDPTSANPTATPTGTTTFTVSTTLGTCIDSAQVTVDVAPPVPAEADPDTEICVGESVALSASGGVSYAWVPGSSLSDPTVQNPTATPAFSTLYTVTVTDAFGCTGTDTALITVRPLPEAIARPDTVSCPGRELTLAAGGGGDGGLYAWSPSTGLDDPTAQFPVYTVGTTTQTFTVTVTNAFGCINTADVTVDVTDYPFADAGEDTVVFLGESITLGASGEGSFFWIPQSSLSNPSIANPQASPTESGYYYVVVTSDIGCQSIDSVFITVLTDPIVEFPNAFSPNGDGANDLFSVIVRGPVEVDVYAIYNRWGEQVFSASAPDVGWDGRYQGTEQETGSYVYVFRGTAPDGQVIERQGTLTLVR
jgi:gliding motility-associated-like protein